MLLSELRPLRPLLLAPALGALVACGSTPSAPPRAVAMTLDARLQRDAAGTGDAGAELVLAAVRVTDAAGNALAAPRLLTKIGQTASIRVGTDDHAIEVQVTSRREGAGVRVDAVLTETGVPGHVTATAVARDRAPAPAPGVTSPAPTAPSAR